jgi:hypothetical protein
MIPPLQERSDLSRPDMAVRLLDRLCQLGLGRGLIDHLRTTGSALVTTFYATAIIADRAGVEPVFCVVTDADCHRIWAPLTTARTSIRYLAPSPRVVRRLVAYGVPRQRIALTGFPLPLELLGGADLDQVHASLARRLVRLDPRGVFRELHRFDLTRVFPQGLPAAEEGRAPMLTFAVGGAGAQADLVQQFLPSLRQALASDRIRLTLVAGVREPVRDHFLRVLRDLGLADALGSQVHLLFAKDFAEYYREFNRVLAATDVLWSKPSEMSFYAALGLPLVVAPPVGAHERYNRRWLREQGVALKQRKPSHAWDWLLEWLEDGTLAGAAWSGYTRLPKDGTYRIVDLVRGGG